MHLLDLPLDIFSDIIHTYVNSNPWKDAARSRNVCRVFAQAILDDMTGRYPIGRYKKDRLVSRTHERKDMMGPHMYNILYKMGPARCHSTYILHHMQAAVDFLINFASDKSLAMRERYRLALCNAVVASMHPRTILTYLNTGPYTDSSRVSANMLRADIRGMVAAAAAVNSSPALRFLLGKIQHFGMCSELYGSPPLAAATNGSSEAATLLRHYLMKTYRLSSQLKRVIERCMHIQRGALLPLLVEWYLPYLTERQVIMTKRRWAAWAIESGHVQVLRPCWNEPEDLHSICELTHLEFVRACQLSHKDIVQYFITTASTLPTSPAKHLCTDKDFCYLTSGLWAAISQGWLRTAKLLLDQGADVNRVCNENNEQPGKAVRLAVIRDDVDMVVLLLVYGAVVPCAMVKYRKANSVMARIVREAWEQQQADRKKRKRKRV